MKQPDPRHLARIIAVQRLFEKEFMAGDDPKFHESYSEGQLATINEFSKYDKELVLKLVKGVSDNKEKADETIRKFAIEWPINQINNVDLQILRVAIFEGFISKNVPAKVAIDEAVELAKELGGPNSAKFVNGVLGNLIENNKHD